MALTIASSPVVLRTSNLQNTSTLPNAQPVPAVAQQSPASLANKPIPVGPLSQPTLPRPQGMSDQQWTEARNNGAVSLQTYRAAKQPTDPIVSVDLSKESESWVPEHGTQAVQAQMLLQANRQPGWLLDLLR